MTDIKKNLLSIQNELKERVLLVAVSKKKSIQEINEAYHSGQRDFGENYVQEMVEKYEQLPKDIRWHFIGHLQRNKVKYIAPFVHLIHGVDSFSLLQEINKQAIKFKRVIPCLLQIHIAKEETKFGLSEEECIELFTSGLIAEQKHIELKGLMGMSTNTESIETIRREFRDLKELYQKLNKLFPTPGLSLLSMGMSNDYKIAIEEGSTLVRIGSAVFGSRI